MDVNCNNGSLAGAMGCTSVVHCIQANNAFYIKEKVPSWQTSHTCHTDNNWLSGDEITAVPFANVKQEIWSGLFIG